MTHQRQLLLGLFVLTTLAVLGFYTLFLSDVKLFGTPETLVVQFPAAKNLREGDSVLLAGMRIGRVSTLSYDPSAPDDRRITVSLRLDAPVQLREGYSVEIRDATLLGGRHVEIEPGSAGAAPLGAEDRRVLIGRIAADPLASLGEVGDIFQRNSERFDRIVEDLEAMVAELRSGGAATSVNETLRDLARTAENAATISADLREGRGALGRLLGEESDELYESWLSAGRELDTTLREIREGEGLVPRLIRDPELATQVEEAVAEAGAAFGGIREFTTEVREGPGLIGRLIRDEEMADDFAQVARNLQSFTGGLAGGEGTLGRLFTSDELYGRLDEIGTNVAQITGQLARGEGTLGRLLQDDEVYEGISLAIRTLNRTLEDLREAAPVSTFTSLFFAAF